MNQKNKFHDTSSRLASGFPAAGDFSRLSVKVLDQPELIVEQWKYLEKFAHDPFSSYTWVKAWYDAHQQKSKGSPIIILGTGDNNRPQFLIPLFRQKYGPFDILLRPGKAHSAYFSGLFSPDCRRIINSNNAARFWNLVFSVVPWADVLAIDGFRNAEIAQNNPLGLLPLVKSTNPSSETRLSSDWVGFYSSKMSSKARSKIRRNEKRLAEHGSFEFRIGKTNKECLELMRALMVQKAEQFKARGIINPYDSGHISAFYENLVQSKKSDPNHSPVISAVLLGEKPLAVNLGMIHANAFYGLIMSMAEGEYERFSPGRILLIRTMQHLSQIGISRFDFGAGDATYKDKWVDHVINRHHVLAPLSIKGHVFACGFRTGAMIKGLIKKSRKLEEITKQIWWHSNKS